MSFKTPEMEAFFKSGRTHPDIVRAAVDFQHFSSSHGLPEPLVSDLWRTKAENTALYLNRFRDLRALAQAGNLDELGPELRAEVASCTGKTDAELLVMAAARTSWHIHGCGIDFSGNPYVTDAQRARVKEFFSRYDKPEWERLTHVVVGHQPHYHLGRRDFAFRKKQQEGKDNA